MSNCRTRVLYIRDLIETNTIAYSIGLQPSLIWADELGTGWMIQFAIQICGKSCSSVWFSGKILKIHEGEPEHIALFTVGARKSRTNFPT